MLGNELIRRVRAAAKGVASKGCRGRARPMREEQRTEWEQVEGGRLVNEQWKTFGGRRGEKQDGAKKDSRVK